ncbi:MAG: RNA polymerase sigma factor [Butyrivibrio sp.]
MEDFAGLLESLYRNEYVNLFDEAVRILGDYYLAEDVVEEVFLTILKHRVWWSVQKDNIRVKYARDICRIICLDLLKCRDGTRLIEFREDVPSDEENVITTSVIERDNINTYLSPLNETDRKIFEYRYCYGMSVKEIAGICGISENNVSQHLSRGRKKIKHLLDT